MFTIYAAMQNEDLTEGRGPMVVRGYFTKKEDAETYAEMLPGVMGIGHGKVEEFIVYGDINEHPGVTKDLKIKMIKSKLTDQELDLLGLKR